jgi:hypothetical protein
VPCDLLFRDRAEGVAMKRRAGESDVEAFFAAAFRGVEIIRSA